jgi:alcohol dehydrogenase class IV
MLNPRVAFERKGQGDGGKEEAKARLECQIGVSYAMLFLHRLVACGASHRIGHMLGPIGNMNHGQTSCILLPAVCKFNAKHSAANPGVLERQKIIRDTLWGISEASNLFEEGGLRKDESDLGDLIEAVVKGLGLKVRLGEVGVGREMFERLAEASLKDPFLVINCVPISKKEEVLEILEMCP